MKEHFADDKEVNYDAGNKIHVNTEEIRKVILDLEKKKKA